MVTCTLVEMGVDVILVLRVWILYGKSPRLLYILIPLLIVEMAVMLTFGALTIIPLKGPFYEGVIRYMVPRLFTFYAVPYLLMAILMFSMTLYKCGQHLMATGLGRMPVVTLFLRDGIFLFATIMLFAVVEIVIWHRGRPTLAQVPTIPATVINAVVGARILLNIKNLANDTNTTTPSMDLSTGSVSFGNRRVGQKGCIPWYLQTGELSGFDSGNSDNS
ncbi:hypothetical protein DFH09DRAFT_1384710 [Mycena vulgaris]|nr:hypothetical protein DFH09DRAFT_1384710 [Mycena vulgaris]